MKRVLVTVSGGVAHVDHVPPGVTVEVRDFDELPGSDGPTCEEWGPGDTVETGRLAKDAAGDYYRADVARPEFDGVRS